jgi:TPR repeat protein
MAGIPTWTILGGGYQSYLKGDYQAAFDEWFPLAELGDAEAQYNLGVMYDEGTSVDQDLVKAAEWYRKAAEQGFVDAQANLGLMYFHGHGVSQDYQAAAHWLNLAVANGDTEAAAILKKIQKADTPQPETA